MDLGSWPPNLAAQRGFEKEGAAAGVLAASGHLAFAVIGTFTVLAVHMLDRPLGRSRRLPALRCS